MKDGILDELGKLRQIRSGIFLFEGISSGEQHICAVGDTLYVHLTNKMLLVSLL